MANRFMTSIAMAALLAGTGVAFGQGAGPKEAPSSGMSTQGSPSTPRSDTGSSGMMKTPQESGESQGDPAKSAGEGQLNKSNQSTQGRSGSERKSSDTGDVRENDKRSSQGQNDQMNTQRQNERTKSQQRGEETNQSGSRSQTTGQASAGAKLSTEQRTKITSVIREQRVQPETNVNFSISVGTRVPKSVHFHPLPTDIVTIYPDWRGYQFFLVRDQIVVVNPRTLEIVAVLEA